MRYGANVATPLEILRAELARRSLYQLLEDASSTSAVRELSLCDLGDPECGSSSKPGQWISTYPTK